MAWNTQMHTEEKNKEPVRSKRKKKLSAKVFSFIELRIRSREYSLFLLRK